MIRLRIWRSSLRRAARWDDAGAGDPEIARLKGLFAAARTEDPEAVERLWWRLRLRLANLGGRREEAQPSLLGILAAAGPRFAAGALCTLALTAGLYLAQSPAPPAPGTAALSGAAEVALLERPERFVGEALEAGEAGELLKFIAYGPNGG